jgi:hypothetical protein
VAERVARLDPAGTTAPVTTSGPPAWRPAPVKEGHTARVSGDRLGLGRDEVAGLEAAGVIW